MHEMMPDRLVNAHRVFGLRYVVVLYDAVQRGPDLRREVAHGQAGSCSRPRTLPSGSVTVATRRPPPTSRGSDFTVPPASVIALSRSSRSVTCQWAIGPVMSLFGTRPICWPAASNPT